ncbi:MAG: primosomal protein N' [Lachnospiraceae bacterium]|nr:primosomal protein N' [Lachnospiraceae bacterium]
MYADIIVDISHEKLDKAFQYIIPPHLESEIEPGVQVMIPFGNGNKLIKGYVLNCTNEIKFDPARMKTVDSVVKKQVSAKENAIRLAMWMKKQYGSTLITALKTVLPVKQTTKGIVKKSIVSCLSKEEWEEKIKGYERKHQVARIRLAQELCVHEVLPYELVTEKLGVSAPIIKSMKEAGLIRIEEENQYRNPVRVNHNQKDTKEMSPDQQVIVDKVLADFDKGEGKHYLIQGITGSGKTFVYINLIKEIIERGKQAIVLIPEIALTYQTVLRFSNEFGDRVTFVNSKLSPGEKYDQFERARRGEVDVVIGPRSALFVPFEKLGIIIIDEEHESSYKSETMPKYHAREVAFELASYYNASVVLGSATPSLEASYLCEQGKMEKFYLKKRLTGGNLPNVYIEDLRKELKEGNRSIFSRRLFELIEDRLSKKEQIILFLNRRGYSGFVSCRTCGSAMKCPHCDVALSEHRNGNLVCHYCGYGIPKPPACPKCGSRYLMGFKAGTQQIEEALWRTFPQAKTLRMDADTTRQKESYEEILSSFANGEADILIGTQMIVKGHDFPNVTLVGVLAADISLYAQDYRASERTFQLLTQAAGRAGRGKVAGDVVIQTYQPEEVPIVLSAAQDYDSFYQYEIEHRELMEYPPVVHMLGIQVMSPNCELAENVIGKLTEYLRHGFCGDGDKIIGPTGAQIGKVKDVFRFVTYAKHPDYNRLIQMKDELESFVEKNVWKNVLVQFDFDPMNVI